MVVQDKEITLLATVQEQDVPILVDPLVRGLVDVLVEIVVEVLGDVVSVATPQLAQKKILTREAVTHHATVNG